MNLELLVQYSVKQMSESYFLYLIYPVSFIQISITLA